MSVLTKEDESMRVIFFMAAVFVVTRGFSDILVILLEKKYLFFPDVLEPISRDLHIAVPLI
jgi:hypothetical protein